MQSINQCTCDLDEQNAELPVESFRLRISLLRALSPSRAVLSEQPRKSCSTAAMAGVWPERPRTPLEEVPSSQWPGQAPAGEPAFDGGEAACTDSIKASARLACKWEQHTLHCRVN